MNTPHKDADLLRAVADGKQMQRKDWDEWVDCTHEAALVRISTGMPTRVKPEPKPDVVRYALARPSYTTWEPTARLDGMDNLRVTFDGETGRIKSAEVVS